MSSQVFTNYKLKNLLLSWWLPFLVVGILVGAGSYLTSDLDGQEQIRFASAAIVGFLAGSFAGFTGTAIYLIKMLKDTNQYDARLRNQLKISFSLVLMVAGCLLYCYRCWQFKNWDGGHVTVRDHLQALGIAAVAGAYSGLLTTNAILFLRELRKKKEKF